jgi:FAD:protein FMN transferase
MQISQQGGLAPRPPMVAHGGWMERAQAIMSTTVSVQLWADDRARGVAAMAAVMAEMQRIERAFGTQRADSELSLVNAAAAAAPVRLSHELYRLVVKAIDFSRLTDGSFDISFASAGALYDYRGGIAPDETALQPALGAIGWQQLELDPVARTLRFAREGMRIDLGGFIKGYALDSATAILARHAVRHAMVCAGGDSRVIGDRRGRPWQVAIRDPRDASRTAAVLPLADTAISTTGDGLRAFVRDGVRHHPLLDPRTGRSPSHLRSVTVLAADALTADALSKAVFVLGLDDGMSVVQSVDGADAVLVDERGTLHCSPGLQRRIS